MARRLPGGEHAVTQTPEEILKRGLAQQIMDSGCPVLLVAFLFLVGYLVVLFTWPGWWPFSGWLGLMWRDK